YFAIGFRLLAFGLTFIVGVPPCRRVTFLSTAKEK
ncbi:MAG: hypothetical protein ACI892_000918, partial [Marinobacter maritimus]